MPAVSEQEFAQSRGLQLQSTWRAEQDRRRAKILNRRDEQEEDDLTDEERKEVSLTTMLREMLRNAVEARRKFETFDKSWDLFHGVFLPPGLPRWRGRIILNKLKSIVLLLQASMTDNKPRLNVQPRVPGSEKSSNLMQHIVDREWDECRAQRAHSMACFYGLLFGTGFVKWGRDPTLNGGTGGFFCEPVVPYRLYFNPGATCVDDAEYVIQCERKPLGWVARHFPEKWRRVARYCGTNIRFEGDEAQRDLINEGPPGESGKYAIHTAVSMDGHTVRVPREGNATLQATNQQMIDVYEFWFRDDAYEKKERQKVVDGIPQTRPARDDSGAYIMEPSGGVEVIQDPFTGQPRLIQQLHVKMQPVMEDYKEPLYPNWRTAVMAGPVLLRDIPNPYETDGAPYSDWRDCDIGAVWGEGEPIQLKDALIGMSRTATMTYDNLYLGGQISWLVNKQSGISPEQIKNRPAAIYPVDGTIGDIKNAMVAIEKPNVTGPFLQLYEVLDKALPALAGLNDVILGGQPPANAAFATMDLLQEQGAASIRLRVRNFEEMLTRSGKLLVALIQQYDDGERPIRVDEMQEARFEWSAPDPETGEREVIACVLPQQAVSVKWNYYTNSEIVGKVDFSVTPDSSLSTSPAGMFNKLMTLFDKKLVDQQYVLEKLNLEDYQGVLTRMRAQALMSEKLKAKPGPKPKAGSAEKAGRAPKPATPQSFMPSPFANAAAR